MDVTFSIEVRWFVAQLIALEFVVKRSYPIKFILGPRTELWLVGEALSMRSQHPGGVRIKKAFHICGDVKRLFDEAFRIVVSYFS